MSRSRKRHRLTLSFALVAGMVLALLAVAVRPSQAAVGDLVFTIETPGVQTSQVTCPAGLVVEDFDAQSADAFSTLDLATGNYATGSFDFVINAADDFGGAGGSGNYIRTDIAESYVFTVDTTAFPNGAGYVGFWWSAGDGLNTLTVNMADGTSQTFDTQSILDSTALVGTPGTYGGHFGNPNATGVLPDEVFAFVNIFAENDDARIKSLVFAEKPEGVGAFESDNHTVCPDILDPGTGSPIPQDGSITIVKEAIPESEQEFEFLTNIGGSGSSFTLKDNGSDPNSITFNNLLPFNYDVTEQVPAGWSLDTIVCRGGSDIVIVEASANVQINLGGSEDVTCTFENEKNGTIVIEKVVADPQGNGLDFPFTHDIPGDGSDNFLLSNGENKEFLSVPVGAYTVTENAANAAFSARLVECVDSDTGGTPSTGSIDETARTGTAAINLDPGETVTCTFTNGNRPLPVTLGWFLAEATGDAVDTRWQTATETANAGFNLYGEIDGQRVRLNDALIQSTVIDAVEPTDYAFSVATSATVFYIETVSLDGASDVAGPFNLGEEYGVYSLPNGVEVAPRIWLPIMVRP